jgi:hypothetical protein
MAPGWLIDIYRAESRSFYPFPPGRLNLRTYIRARNACGEEIPLLKKATAFWQRASWLLPCRGVLAGALRGDLVPTALWALL